MPISEADTCRKYIVPKFYDADWTDDQISEQKTFTDGRIVVLENKCKRRQQKRADYILRYKRDFMIALIEAKSAYRNAADGIQQAKEYAQTLGVKFAYATNGKQMIEHNFLTGKESSIPDARRSDDAPNTFNERPLQQSKLISEVTYVVVGVEPCNCIGGMS